jgi:hypothetical protein
MVMRRNNVGVVAAVVAGVGVLIGLCQGCDRPPVSGRVETATGYIEYQKVHGAWLLVEYDRRYDVTVSEPVQTASGPVAYVKEGWWGSWQCFTLPAQPEPGAAGAPTYTGDSGLYQGLSEDEKQSIWRGAMPYESEENLKKMRNGE